MSTFLAILELVEYNTTSIDYCKSTVGIFIDIKMAFDTVVHDYSHNKNLLTMVSEVLLISGSVVILGI